MMIVLFDYVISKISRHTGILYKIRDNLPTKTRLDYYYAYIYPYLSYCTIIWGCAYQTHLNPLFIQQKRTIRTIVNAGFRDHTDPHFKALKLLKVQDIYINSSLGAICSMHELEETMQLNQISVLECLHPTVHAQSFIITLLHNTRSHMLVQLSGTICHHIYDQLIAIGGSGSASRST